MKSIQCIYPATLILWCIVLWAWISTIMTMPTQAYDEAISTHGARGSQPTYDTCACDFVFRAELVDLDLYTAKRALGERWKTTFE